VNNQVFEKAVQAVNLLKEKNLKIATAESCTGGLVSGYITAVSGASAVFELGVTSYSNEIKNAILKVDAKTLQNFGAVSADTAKLMAENVKTLAKADIGLSVTGVAGPASQEGHPVGTVFIGVSGRNGTVTQKLAIDPKDRNFVREQAVFLLLEALIEYIEKYTEN
jgi:nicotinamide-nucleotide amidase